MKITIPDSLAALGLPSLMSQRAWLSFIYVISLGCLFIYMRRIGLDMFGGFAFALSAVVFISTLYNFSNIDKWANVLLPCSGVIAITAVLYKDHYRELLWGVMLASVIYLLLNLVFIIICFFNFEQTNFNYLFFNYKNSTFMIIFPALACSLLLDVERGKKCSARTVGIAVVCLAETLVAYSATTLVAVLVTMIALALAQIKRLRPFVNGATVLGLYLVSFVLIVVARLHNFSLFFISGVLGKTITFTGRTDIWDEAFGVLLGNSHFITGYGADYVLEVLPPAEVPGEFYAHNDFLHYFMMGGVFAALCYIVLLVLVSHSLYRARECDASVSLSAIFAGLSMIALMESTVCVGSCFLLAIAYYRTREYAMASRKPPRHATSMEGWPRSYLR